MTALAPALPMLSKLIPRLATDHDGEVVATVRAIQRTLKAAGLDFHDLASALAKPTRPTWAEEDPASTKAATWQETARWCASRLKRLNPREAEFVCNMQHRASTSAAALSPKQAAWLDTIAAKLRRHA